MSAKIKTEKPTDDSKIEYVSYSKNEDYKAIKLLSDGKTYVEHKTLANNLVKKKLAEYVKDAKIEVDPITTKHIEDIEK